MEYVEEGVVMVESPDLLFGKLRSGWDPWTTLRRMQYLKNRDYDLVHAFETRPATIYPILNLMKRKRIPLAIDWIDWWGHGGLIVEHRPLWYRLIFSSVETWFEEHFRPLADASTVISRGLKRRAESLGVSSQSIFWVPNGCSTKETDSPPVGCRAFFNIPENSYVVGFSALDVTMGIEIVLEAIAILAKNHPNVILMMTGKCGPPIASKISQNNISKITRVLGYLNTEDYKKAISCANVFVIPFPQRVANLGRWPGRINDYLSAGIPVVTNPVGEMKELLSLHKIGLLAREDKEDISEKIQILMKDKCLSEKMSKNARNLAANELSWKSIVDRVEETYQYALSSYTNRMAKPNIAN